MALASRRSRLHTFSQNVHHSFTKRSPPNRGPFVVVPFSATPVDDSPFSPLPTFSSFLGGAQTSDPCRGFGSSPPSRTSAFFPPGLQSATPVEDSALLGSSEYVLMLKRATPVEDSALRLQGGLPRSFPQRSKLRPLSRIRLFRSSTLHHGPHALPRRRQDAPRCTQDAAWAPQAAPSTAQEHPRRPETSRRCPPRRPNKRFPPSGRPLPLFGSNFHSIVIAAVVPAPCICGVLTTLGGRAGYGKNRKLFAS